MGNTGSSSSRNGRRRHRNRRTGPPPPPPPQSQQEVPPNRYVYAAATPYPSQYPNAPPPPYYPYPSYYQPSPSAMPMPFPAPYDHHHRVEAAHWTGGGRYPCGPMMMQPTPYMEHQKAATIRNDVNLKRKSLRLEADEENPGKFLVSFTFDADVAASITVIFFAKEGDDCTFTPTVLPPVTVSFEKGLGQKFRQPSGTGIDLSKFDEELLSKGEMDVYPLAVKAEAALGDQNGSDGNQTHESTNSQITQAVFEKEKGVFLLRVLKQILWANQTRYELQEIYGIGNSVENDEDANDSGKECVICLSEPRDTTVLPCRHMCLCSGCAKVLRFQTNRCPICRQPVERLLEIKADSLAAE